MAIIYHTQIIKYVFGFLVILLKAELHDCGETCLTGPGAVYSYCEHGCCNKSCCSYTISTSVLIVAGIVGGLIAIALVVAIVICCVKTYRDKRANRTRQLRPGHGRSREEHIPRRPVEPRKPPAYTEEPPPYSTEMPESHFRPFTVTGQAVPYNQRYRTPVPQNYGQLGNTTAQSHQDRTAQGPQTSGVNSQNRNNAAAGLRRSGAREPEEDNSQSTAELPGVPTRQPPPAYATIEMQAQSQRRRRFIQTPTTINESTSEETETISSQNVESNIQTQDGEVLIPSRGITQNGISANRQTDNMSNSNVSVPGYIGTDPHLRSSHSSTQRQNTQNSIASESVSVQPGRNSVAMETGGSSRMVSSVSRIRSRQTVTPGIQQRNQIASRRQAASSLRPTTEINYSEIEELACL